MLLTSNSYPLGARRACHNLRPASNLADALTPVHCAPMAIEGDFRFGIATASGLLAYDASRIICIEGATHYTVAELNGRVPQAFADGGNRVMVACADRWLGLKHADGRWTLEGEIAGWDSMPHIFSTPAEPVSVTIPARQLRNSLADGARMADADARDISSSLTAAYERIAVLTASAGAMLQPRAVGYRILDAAGRVLFTSPMLIYGEPRLAESWALTGNAAQDALDPVTVTAKGYRLHLRVPPQPSALLRALAARIEVVASPQMHTFDDAAPIDVRQVPALQRPTVARAAMPGAETSTLSPASASAPELARRLAACQQEWRVLATVERPFAAGPEDEAVIIDIPAEAAATDLDRAALRRAWAWRPERMALAEAWARSPHMVSAVACASASGVTLMAGLTVRPFRGYELPLLAVETERKPWRALVTVTFADGSVISQAAEGDDYAPVRLSPLLSYPAPSAVRMAVQLVVNDSPVRVQAFDMRPDMRCRDSVWAAPTLASPSLRESTGGIGVPPDTAAPLSLPRAVAVCAQGQPLAAFRAAECAGAALRAAVPVARGPQSWDFGRARFLIGGDGGLQCAVVSADRRDVAVTLLDPRPVAHQRALTAMADGEAAALAGRDMLRVKGSAVTTIATELDASMVAWNPSRGELWALGGEGARATVFPLAAPGRFFTAAAAEMPEVADVSASPVDMYLSGGGSVARASSGTDSEPDSSAVPIAWAAPVAMPRQPSGKSGATRGAIGAAMGEARLVVPLATSHFFGTVTVAHGHTPGPEAVIARFSLRGPILAPLRLPIAPYPASELSVAVEGIASADSILRRPYIVISNS